MDETWEVVAVPSTEHGPTPMRDLVRRAFGQALLRDALLLKLTEIGLRALLKGDNVNALDEYERKHVRFVAQEIGACRRILTRIGKRCTNETE